MKIDNQKNTYRIWLSRLVTTIVFALLILLILFIPWFDQPDSGIGKYHLIILISVIYVALNWVNYMKRPFFISYSDQGEMLVIRYYPVSMFTSRKHSIEIPKQHFLGYETRRFFLGREQKLILVQKFRGKEAKYPPISLSALDRDEQERLLESLQKYALKK